MALTVRSRGCGEFEDRRSRFISQVVSVQSRADVENELQLRRAEFPDASHVVHAFCLGPPEGQTLGMSDDHEPHGTAGRPVLDILTGRDVTQALVTVVRYFGGTKLGTGGLVRAYAEAARIALDDATLEVLTPKKHFSLEVSYAALDAVKHILDTTDAQILGETYETSVRIEGLVAIRDIETTVGRIRDATRGSARIVLSEDE